MSAAAHRPPVARPLRIEPGRRTSSEKGTPALPDLRSCHADTHGDFFPRPSRCPPPSKASCGSVPTSWSATYNRVTSCRIALERPTGNHHHDGGPYRVASRRHRPRLRVGGGQAVGRAVHRHPRRLRRRRPPVGGVRGTAAATSRSHRRERRRKGRSSASSPRKASASSRPPMAARFYFHRNAVDDPGFEKLTVGSRVRFAEHQGFEGPQASTVSLVEAEGALT